MRATGVGNLGKKKIRYTPDMILTFLVAIANCREWEERSGFIFERHPELKGELTKKNFKELSIRHGWYKSAMKMKETALKIAVENARAEKAELTSNALHNELEMVRALEEERSELMGQLRIAEKGTKSYSSVLADLGKVSKMISELTDTDRIRRQDALADSAAMALHIAEKRGELKSNLNEENKIVETSTILTEEDDAFLI